MVRALTTAFVTALALQTVIAGSTRQSRAAAAAGVPKASSGIGKAVGTGIAGGVASGAAAGVVNEVISKLKSLFGRHDLSDEEFSEFLQTRGLFEFENEVDGDEHTASEHLDTRAFDDEEVDEEGHTAFEHLDTRAFDDEEVDEEGHTILEHLDSRDEDEDIEGEEDDDEDDGTVLEGRALFSKGGAVAGAPKASSGVGSAIAGGVAGGVGSAIVNGIIGELEGLFGKNKTAKREFIEILGRAIVEEPVPVAAAKPAPVAKAGSAVGNAVVGSVAASVGANIANTVIAKLKELFGRDEEFAQHLSARAAVAAKPAAAVPKASSGVGAAVAGGVAGGVGSAVVGSVIAELKKIFGAKAAKRELFGRDWTTELADEIDAIVASSGLNDLD